MHPTQSGRHILFNLIILKILDEESKLSLLIMSLSP
jgi:hypothetical protein